jgi:hypothetical protein
MLNGWGSDPATVGLNGVFVLPSPVQGGMQHEANTKNWYLKLSEEKEERNNREKRQHCLTLCDKNK